VSFDSLQFPGPEGLAVMYMRSPCLRQTANYESDKSPCVLQVLILKRVVHPLEDWWCVGGRMKVVC
jgi:hypothetical protein